MRVQAGIIEEATNGQWTLTGVVYRYTNREKYDCASMHGIGSESDTPSVQD